MNKILLATIAADGLFLAGGAAQLAFSLIVRNTMDDEAVEGRQAARNLLYQRFPLEAGLVNAIFVFVTFLVTLPGLATPARSWLKLSGFLVTICAIFTLCIGIFLWVLTLNSGNDFFDIWMEQDSSVQSLMQTSVCSCSPRDLSGPWVGM